MSIQHVYEFRLEVFIYFSIKKSPEKVFFQQLESFKQRQKHFNSNANNLLRRKTQLNLHRRHQHKSWNRARQTVRFRPVENNTRVLVHVHQVLRGQLAEDLVDEPQSFLLPLRWHLEQVQMSVVLFLLWLHWLLCYSRTTVMTRLWNESMLVLSD